MYKYKELKNEYLSHYIYSVRKIRSYKSSLHIVKATDLIVQPVWFQTILIGISLCSREDEKQTLKQFNATKVFLRHTISKSS